LPGEFDVRRIDPTIPEGLAALHLAMDAAGPGPGVSATSRVAEVVEHATRRSGGLELLFGAYHGGRLVSAAVASESPGASALVFVPSLGLNHLREDAGVAVLSALLEAAWNRSLKLLQVLLAPEATSLARVLSRAGFRYLTRLLYLRRDVPGPPRPAHTGNPRLTWLSFRPDREALFCRALEESYARSLDCPELIGLRTMPEVLEGHRATGEHDAKLWWVALRDESVVGVLLLTRLAGRSAMEVVYVGVAQPARGQGVADVLLGRALDTCLTESVRTLALAVDHGNTPARRMYERWAFGQTGVRDAWIASPKPI